MCSCLRVLYSTYTLTISQAFFCSCHMMNLHVYASTRGSKWRDEWLIVIFEDSLQQATACCFQDPYLYNSLHHQKPLKCPQTNHTSINSNTKRVNWYFHCPFFLLSSPTWRGTSAGYVAYTPLFVFSVTHSATMSSILYCLKWNFNRVPVSVTAEPVYII